MKKRSAFILTLSISILVIVLIAYGLEKLTFNNADFSFFGINKNNSSDFLNEDENMQTDQNSDNLIVKGDGFTKNSVATSSGYESLGNNLERQLYNLIKSDAGKITNEKYKTTMHVIEPLTINGKLDSAQVKKIIYAIQNDHPEIFWVANTFSYNISGSKTVLKLNSILSPSEQKAASEQLELKVSSIIKKIPGNYSEYETEMFLHDNIIGGCKYEKITANVAKCVDRLF